jgi:hypothetical protein
MPGERLSMSVGWAGEEPLILDPPEGLRRLARQESGGRAPDSPLVEDESVAPVVADAVGAILALLHGRLGLHCTAVEIPCEWVERGEVFVADVEALLATRHVALEERLSAAA